VAAIIEEKKEGTIKRRWGGKKIPVARGGEWKRRKAVIAGSFTYGTNLGGKRQHTSKGKSGDLCAHPRLEPSRGPGSEKDRIWVQKRKKKKKERERAHGREFKHVRGGRKEKRCSKRGKGQLMRGGKNSQRKKSFDSKPSLYLGGDLKKEVNKMVNAKGPNAGERRRGNKWAGYP